MIRQHSAIDVKAHHPSYILIWGILLTLVGASIALGHVPNVALMNTLVFGVAAIKALLVLRYFMNLRFEPWLIAVILVSAVLCLAILFIGVMPDVTWRNGWTKH